MGIWIQQNIASILICAVLLAVVAAIVIKVRRDKRKGCSSCGCGCTDCTCHNTHESCRK